MRFMSEIVGVVVVRAPGPECGGRQVETGVLSQINIMAVVKFHGAEKPSLGG